MAFHKHGAYDGFDSLDEVAPHYKRCRKRKAFILSDAGVKVENPKCDGCGAALLDPPDNENISGEGRRGANRCHYYPRQRRLIVFHYACAWHNILTSVVKLGRIMQGG